MLINVADLVDKNDLNGRTFRQINNEKQHAIPLGTLVEVDVECSDYHKMRGYVVSHDRDCDGTPLYSLGPKGFEEKLKEHLPRERYDEYEQSEDMKLKRYLHMLQRQRTWHGFDEDSLIVVND